MTANSSAVTTVSAGTVVTLTATVHAAGAALTTGQVNFCDASAKYCTDIHILATAQLTSAGTATFKLRPGIGSHNYKAVFLGTNAYTGSASAASALTVTGTLGPIATGTTVAYSGSWGNYALMATVTEAGRTTAPTGSVSFLDASNGNLALATHTLGPAVAGVGWLNPKAVNAAGTRTELIADLNGDGIPDLVVNDNPVVVFLGHSDGTYTEAPAPSISGPTAGPMAVADFNGDGIPDLAVAMYGSSSIAIVLGNGDGTFAAPILVSLPSTSTSVSELVTADFNGDGIADLIAVDNYDSNVDVLLGKGDGTFSLAAAPPLSIRPACVAIGDFNGDGVADLAIADSYSDTVDIVLGSGDGTFKAGSSVNSGTIGSENGDLQIAAADFNGDGKLDLAVAAGGLSGTADTVTLLAGNGDGTFNSPTLSQSAKSTAVTWIQVADFNQDGTPDVVLADSNGNVSVLLNNGSGSFGGDVPVVTGLNVIDPLTTDVGDLNGDGYPDIATGGYYNSTLGLYFTEPTETATASANISLPAGFHQVDATYAGDSNDLASVSGTIPLWGIPPATTTSLTVTSGGVPVTSVAPGTKVTLTATVTAGSSPVTAGQVNFCDASAVYCTDVHILGTATLTSNGAAIFNFVPGAGTHTYKAVLVEDGYGLSSSSNPETLTVGPAPNPVYTDTTVISSSGYPGNYSLTGTVVGYGGTASPTGNLSFLDTSFGNASLGSATLGTSTPGLGWLISQTPAAGGYLASEVAGDFNGDGIPDLALLWSSSTFGGPYSVTIFLGKGDGTFTAGPTTGATGVQVAPYMITGDFNGDGKTDLAILSATSSYSNTNVTVLLNNGGGTFAVPQTTVADNPGVTGGDIVSGAMVAADFNGDGRTDLAIVGGLVASGEVTILLGNGDGTFTSSGASYGYASSFSAIAAGDFNGDGIPDLVVANYFSPGAATVLLGKGDGTFTALPALIPVNTFVHSIVVGDFNSDGKLDLAFGYNGAVGVYLGKGDGTFTQATGSPVAGAGLSLIAGDFNRDGKLDMAGIDNYNNQIDLFLGAGNGTFTEAVATPNVSTQIAGPNAIVAADFNNDGVPDLAMVSGSSASASMLLTEPTETASATIAGLAPIGAGTHNVEANYLGDKNYPSSVSGTVALTAGLAPLVISPAAGTYTSAQTVTISESISGATIYYEGTGIVQTNGFVPYTGPITLAYGGSESIQAYATENGYQQSNTASAQYAFNFPVAPAPTFSVAGGTYPSAQTVTISDSQQGATIYYTTNGTIPTTASAQYTGPITVSSSETIVASAIAYGYAMSNPSSAQYLISSSSTPFIYTLAGNGVFGYSGDGSPATSADLNQPQGIAIDSSGNIYIADTSNNIIRKVAAGTGTITRIAGTVGDALSGTSYTGDGGPATSATLAGPNGLALDNAGNLYIADTYNNVVRKINLSTGIITTYAGNGTAGYSGDGGSATSAELNSPDALAFDSHGNLYIADTQNDSIREVNVSTGNITTVAGTGTAGYSGDGGPAAAAKLYAPMGIAFDGTGNLYIADSYNRRIREVNASTGTITTIAGTGVTGYSGDGGPATSAQIYQPIGIGFDSAGNLYFSDEWDLAIRKIAASTGTITTIAGSGYNTLCDEPGGDGGPAASATPCLPTALQVDSAGNIYFAQSGLSRIRVITAPRTPPTTTTAAPTFSISAGTYASPQTVTVSDATKGASIYISMDGSTPSTAQLAYHGPINVSGSVTIKAVAVAPGYLPSTVASAAYSITSTPRSVITTIAGSGIAGTLSSGVSALSARFPEIGEYQVNQGRMAVDSAGNIFFSEPGYESIWEIVASTKNIELVAGNNTAGYSGDGGLATTAELNSPAGVAVDNAGNLYIADAGNNRIRKVNLGTGIITTVAGGNYGALGDGGLATAASLYYPNDVTVDSAGNLYIADSFDWRVRKVSASTGIITTVAGTGTSSTNTVSLGDGGPATSATLFPPFGVALDGAGNLYIACEYSIRKVSVSTGIISTLAGNNIPGYSGDNGPGASAEIEPYAIAVDPSGDVYFNNYANGIREIPAGTTNVITAVGNGFDLYGGDGGSATIAGIFEPQGVALDAVGNLYVNDFGDHRIRKVTFNPAATPAFNPAAGTYSSAQSVTITDSTQGAVIYYTTDGSTPTSSSSVYSGAISVSQTTTLKAIAVATGYPPSAVASATYTISIIGVATPTLSVTPSAQTINNSQSASLTVTVSGSSGLPTPTGTVTLSSGSYSAQQSLSGGTASFTIPAGTLAAGSNSISIAYSGDSNYGKATGTAVVTVSQVVMSATSPAAVSPGAAVTATISLNAGSNYSGTMDLNCKLTSSPSGAQSLPTCSLNPTSVTVAAGGSATATLTVQTTAAGTTALLHPSLHDLRWLGGEGATLAVVLLFGIPAKRRRWLSYFALAMVVALVGTAVVGCGGGGQVSSSTPPTTTPATTAGNYTFTVTGTDSANASITASADVTITVQ